MGCVFVKNDTLRINKEQGFPESLDIETHLKTPYSLEAVADQEFSFSGKDKVRIYNAPPVRTFLVEEIDGKWIYWGLCHITEVTNDYVNSATSGKYKIIQLYTPEQMRQMFELTHFANKDQDYFAGADA